MEYDERMQALKQLNSAKVDTSELQQTIRARAMKIKNFLDLKDRFEANRSAAIGDVQTMIQEVQSDEDSPVRIRLDFYVKHIEIQMNQFNIKT